MAFIKNKERKSLVSKINQSYGFRKFLISFEIIAMIGFIIVMFLHAVEIIKEPFYNAGTNASLTWFGILMLVWAIVITLFGIVALILTFTLKSPKTVKSEIDKLQSSAISGQKVKRNKTSVEINEARTTFKEPKVKTKKGKK